MSLDNIRAAIRNNKVEWKKHAVKRLFERGIESEEVLNAIETGEIIERYPDAVPLPCYLINGFSNAKPVHVVVAFDDEEFIVHIITVYYPDNSEWHFDWKTRR